MGLGAGRLAGAVALLLVTTSGCVDADRAATAGRAAPAGRLGPAVDHHQHLLSSPSAALLEKFEGGGPLTAIALPSEVSELLARRTAAWNDAAALAGIYADDAIVLENRPISGGKTVAQHVSQRFGRPYTLLPLAYAAGGDNRRITAMYARGEGAERSNIGLTLITLVRDAAGKWRIASETMKFPGPPEYRTGGADALIKLLDEAHVERAVVLSTAYFFESPFLKAGPEGAAMLRAENDWTAAEVARHPKRLVGFCGVNPLTEQAIGEIQRCKEQLGLTGIKLHFGNSDVELENPEHLSKVKAFFAAANRLRMPVAAHLWTIKNYGRPDSEIFLAEVLPQAPDVVVQIMHMAGAGPGWTDEALEPFAVAAAANDPRMKNVYFDVATVADDRTPAQLELLARRIRQIGPARILYGSDASFGGRPTPDKEWGNFRGMVPLTDAEFAIIRDNVAPYLR